jgi:thiol-disulfide isomerase/thioredoxin
VAGKISLWLVLLLAVLGTAVAPGATRAGSTQLESVDVQTVARLAANETDSWLLINMWATWCTPCLTELPLLVDLHGRYRDRGLEVVTLSIDDLEQRRDVLEFLEKIDASTRNLIVGLVDTRKLANALDSEWHGPLPYTVLIAPGGGVVHRKLGAFEPAELEAVIIEQLGASGP